jgi:uracil-DNA glycosylase
VDLNDVYENIRENDCWDELRGPGIVLVKGRGNSRDPMAMIVGEAPGATENTKRRPFCGPSGRVLKQLMDLAGLYAEDQLPWGNDGDGDSGMEVASTGNSFITNVVKYRPPGNRTPTTREIHFGQMELREEWKAIGRPRLLVAVGAVARAALVPAELSLRPGQWAALKDGQTYVWVQYHPAWGLRQGNKGRETMENQWEAMGEWIGESDL